MFMSLYRRYRPLDFSSLLGQEHIRDILLGALKQQKVSHAYLFTGPRGTGKTSTARIMARAINCLDLKDSGPCNTCQICLSALEESLTDLVEIDAASHGLVDDARALVEQARFMPTQAKKKIYIIDEVHMLSKSAFNALLKIIEEPPEHVHFILATTEAHKVLDTIKSRCQRFDFHLADEDTLVSALKNVCDSEKVAADEPSLRLLARHARGSFRDGLSLLEQVIGSGALVFDQVRESLGISDSGAVEDFLQSLFAGKKEDALKIVHDVHEGGADLSQFCQSILSELRTRLLQGSSQYQILAWIDIFFLALDQLRDTFIPVLPLELAVMKCLPSEDSVSPVLPKSVQKEVQKPRKVVVAPTISHEVSPVVTDLPVPPTPTTRPNAREFDLAALLPHLSSVSLRSLLKHSTLQFFDDELQINARSEFELSKIREATHLSQLSEALNSLYGKKIQLKFEVQAGKKEDLPSSAGLSNNELQSVFS